jgi:Mycotoxin biosynthesis protein UstYa
MATQNSIRIALHKNHYEPQFPQKFHPTTGPYGKKHITHCIEALREALMCASDTSVLVWKWHEGSHASMGHSDVLHTCRNFEKIWEWGWEHRAPVPFDNRAFVPSTLDD